MVSLHGNRWQVKGQNDDAWNDLSPGSELSKSDILRAIQVSGRIATKFIACANGPSRYLGADDNCNNLATL